MKEKPDHRTRAAVAVGPPIPMGPDPVPDQEGVVPVARTRRDLSLARDRMVGPVAVVMTMGALHDGHGALLRAARERVLREGGSVIATIFVNPLQFGPSEDFARYPRTLESDLAVCRETGVDLVFAPSAAEMYPSGAPSVRVDPGPLGARLEGAFRPGFFGGVLTVVLKLLALTRADVAFFGEKDFQQLAMIRSMVEDFTLPVEIVGVPTVREVDGLARSSRNRYLSPPERRSALALSAALFAGAAAGPSGAEAVLKAARAVIEEEPAVVLDYLTLTAPDLGDPPTGGGQLARLLVAARVGQTRLIDNLAVEIG